MEFKVDKKCSIKCKCGSKSIEPKLFKDDCDEYRWVNLRCRKCNNTIFYNGA